jgi:hypothetical protein
MCDNSTTYYINENENIFEFFALQGIELSSSISKQVAFISNKTSNNYIGFYQFLHDGDYLKFYVIPKIYKNASESDKEKLFVKFLSKYYTLNNRYPGVKHKSISGNIRDIIFEGYTNIESEDIKTFIEQKYLSALKTLDAFFRKYNKKRTVSTHYISQTLEYKLNLSRSITSVNKSTIHQIKETEVAYSRVAHITEQALLNFKKGKLNAIENNQTLLDKTNSILNTIKKRFKNREKETFKDKHIVRHKIAKLFRKTNELKEVYEALLIIIGLEHYKSDKQSSEIIKIPNMTALFFRPEELYEWIVYDTLKDNNKDATILRQSECEIRYVLRTGDRKLRTVKSIPDFVIIDNDVITVIDAKWKIINFISDIQFEDIAKLERDYILRKKESNKNEDTKGKDVCAQLIYPKVELPSEDCKDLSNDYNSHFKFEVRQIEV